ncbi:MAG: ferredoxin--NADP reductase [Segetibacter sp.]|nr:ferredoxin--NADP reductase [Segetibacter sp.]
MAKIFTVTVVKREEESHNALTIKFKQPALKKIKYNSGQYITLIVRVNGRTYRRPYSISSVFGIDTTLDITVKSIKEGIVSNFLFETVAVGDTFEMMEPMGKFVLPDHGNTSPVLWSAGSGITPAWSILRSVLYQQPSSLVTLIYSNRNRSSVIFNKQIHALEKEFESRLKVYHIFSKPEKKDVPYYFEGRISREAVQNILSEISGSHSRPHFICGPTEMMELIKVELTRDNIPERLIFFENFHNTIDKSELAGVKPATVLLKTAQQEYTFEVPFGKNILEACLDAAIDFPYSCQTGSCTFCKATLRKGYVKTITHQKPEKELYGDECLLCCSYPLEEEIILQA